MGIHLLALIPGQGASQIVWQLADVLGERSNSMADISQIAHSAIDHRLFVANEPVKARIRVLFRRSRIDGSDTTSEK